MRAVRTVSILRQFTQGLSLDSLLSRRGTSQTRASFRKGVPMETPKNDFTVAMRKRFFLVWINSPAGREWIKGHIYHGPEVNPDTVLAGPIPIERRNVLRVIERIHSAGLSVGFEKDEEWSAKVSSKGARPMKQLMIAILVGLLACPLSFSETRQSERQSTEAPHLSVAVVNGATEAVRNLQSRLKNNSQTDADVSSAATALSILFTHAEETGYNAYLQKRILENPDTVMNLDGHPEISTSQRQQFLRQVRVFGMLSIEAQLVRRVQELSRVEQAKARAGVGKFALATCYLAADAATAGILAVLSPPPLDAIMGVIAGVYGLLAAWRC